MRVVRFACLGLLLLVIHESSSSRIYAALKKGLVPVQFTQYGQPSLNLPTINLPPKTLPILQKPTIKLPALVPPPKSIRNMYQCLKSILRPQFYQQMVVVPQLKRYLRTIQAPVLETIHLKRPLSFCPYC